MVSGNTHSSGNISLIKHQQRTGGGMVDPFPLSFKPPLKCFAVFADIMIQATKTAVFFCTERAAKRFAKASHILKMVFQKLSFRLRLGRTVGQILFDRAFPPDFSLFFHSF